MKQARRAMQKTVDHFAEQIKGLRLGSVTPSLVDTIKVSQYGQLTPIKHIAQSGRQGSGISVEPHDPKMVGPICNALKEAGFNAYQFSKTCVMVSVPPPCGEEKERVRKRISTLAEEAKVAIRNQRKKFKKHIEDGELKTLQKATDDAVDLVNDMAARKIEAI